MIDPVLILLAFAALVAGSLTDIKIREIPDWISYGLIAGALGMRLLYSVLNNEFISFLSSSFFIGLAGFIACFLFANLIYRLRQWGGGDAKLLMGMGALLGFTVNLGIFFLLLIGVGAVYGIGWSIYLAGKNTVKFKRSFKENMDEFRLVAYAAILFILVGVAYLLSSASALGFLLFGISIIFGLGIISFIFTKAVEESCLLQNVKASQLTEGDWIAETIKLHGRTIITEKNLGVTKAQIKQLQRYKKPILIKVGIPFIPVFLLSFIALLAVQTIF